MDVDRYNKLKEAVELLYGKSSGVMISTLEQQVAQIMSLRDELAQLRVQSNINSRDINDLKNYAVDQVNILRGEIQAIKWNLPPLDLMARAY